jgi:hypothetical protein
VRVLIPTNARQARGVISTTKSANWPAVQNAAAAAFTVSVSSRGVAELGRLIVKSVGAQCMSVRRCQRWPHTWGSDTVPCGEIMNPRPWGSLQAVVPAASTPQTVPPTVME